MRDDYQKAMDNDFNVQNQQGVLIDAKPDDRLATNYTNKDQGWHTGTHSGDIYISTPNDTHDQIVNHHNHMNDPGYDGRYDLPESGYPGVSGFFTDENTASHSFTDDGKFDSVQLGHDLQQAPYYDDNKAETTKENGEIYNPEYNGHLDCFRVNPEKMQKNYGTTDFYAAMSSCTGNTAWGDGGGFQGYNPHINEMINNGSLEYVPENARTCNLNTCTDYSDRKKQVSAEASAVNEHIKTNNIHGTPNARLGYNEISQNADKNTGTDGGVRNPNDQIAGELPPPTHTTSAKPSTDAGTLPKESSSTEAEKAATAGTLPNEKQGIDLSSATANSSKGEALSDEATQAAGTAIT